MSEPKRRAPAKPTKIIDCTFANAVKIGKHQLLYINGKQYDISLKGAVLSIRKKDWKAADDTVYTTINNLIYWR